MTIKNIEYDYVVVGSGAGGGIVFDELKKKNKNVLLIEKGPHIKSENLKKEFFYSLKNVWKYSGYQYASGNISLPILQGVSVGGSTTINGSIMQDLEENFCNRIIQKLDTKNKNFRFDNLLNYQKEIYNEFNIESGSKEFLHNNKLIEEIKRKNWKCELSKRAISDKNYEGRTLSGNSVENVILRKYIGSDIINNTDVKLIIKEEKKILGISCFNKLEKKTFL